MERFDALISSSPARLSGIPCFVGTRVPVHTLFDYLAGGSSLSVFLDDFPTVSQEQAVAVLRSVGEYLDDLLTAPVPGRSLAEQTAPGR